MTEKNSQILTSKTAFSTITSGGKLEISIANTRVSPPAEGEVTVRVEATPVNPTDVGLMLGPADLASLTAESRNGEKFLSADIPEGRLANAKTRLDKPQALGVEGAGTIVDAGPGASDLIGKRVAMMGGAMFSTLRTVPLRDCIILPEDTTAAEGASLMVNPQTALGMVDTMRREGHKALVHTAAASNLGCMLNRICISEGVPLVNIVRSDAHVQFLKELGAEFIVNSSAPNFFAELTDAITRTGATIAFDAIGGGDMADTILRAMEAAITAKDGGFHRYGSAVHKQIYTYGSLDTSPVVLTRSYGMAFGLSGYLLFNFLGKLDAQELSAMRQHIVRDLRTTFSSAYSQTIPLEGLLDPQIVQNIAKRATGKKFLIAPDG